MIKYDSAELEIIKFAAEDVITTSSVPATPLTPAIPSQVPSTGLTPATPIYGTVTDRHGNEYWDKNGNGRLDYGDERK